MLPWWRVLLLLLASAGLVHLALLGLARVRLTHIRPSSTQAADYAAHGRTLSVARAVYVASLPRRADRRADMAELARRLGADFTFVDAVDAHDPAISNILDHVRTLRASGDAYPTKFSWPAHTPALHWTIPLLDAPANDSTPLWANIDDATPQPFADGDGPDWFRLDAAKIACWETHLRLLRRIAAWPAASAGLIGAGDVAIILEDDVDVELDIRDRLAGLWPALPTEWDVVYLGRRCPSPRAATAHERALQDGAGLTSVTTRPLGSTPPPPRRT
jgi:hypothetical protein